MNKRHNFSVAEKLEVLNKYDELPRMNQRLAAYKLNVSQCLLGKILKNQQEIKNASWANTNSDQRRKRVDKEEEIEEALGQWLIKAIENNVHVTGPLLCQKAQDLAKKMGKNDFVATDGWYHQWRKRKNIIFSKEHEKQEKVNHEYARLWINSEWQSLIIQYTPSCVFNANETIIHFRELHKYTFMFKDENVRKNKCNKEPINILCCASMDGQKKKLLAIGRSKNPRCFKGINDLPINYTANSNVLMTKAIFTDWLTKWDNELRHNILLLVDDCATHAVTVTFIHIKLMFLPAIVQPCDQGIICAFKANYRMGIGRYVINLIDAAPDQTICTLRAHEIAKKITVLDGLHLANEAWNIVSKITICNSFRNSGLIFKLNEVDRSISRTL